MNYTEELTDIINRLMTDEISAATMYIEASGYIKQPSIAGEILEHADEEYGHFKKLVEFATAHDLRVSYDFDRAVTKKISKDESALLSKIQTLEKKAIADYKMATLFARENNDIEAEKLFADIMVDETEHFDDVAQYLGQSRNLGESYVKTFKSIFKNG